MGRATLGVSTNRAGHNNYCACHGPLNNQRRVVKIETNNNKIKEEFILIIYKIGTSNLY